MENYLPRVWEGRWEVEPAHLLEIAELLGLPMPVALPTEHRHPTNFAA